MNTRAEHAALLNAIKLTNQCNSITEIVSRVLPKGEGAHSAHFYQGFHRQVNKAVNGVELAGPEEGAMHMHREAYFYGVECAKAAGFDDVMQKVCDAATLPRDMHMPE